jgi:cytochrome bd-type quinol oxidase subunit 2
MTDSTLPGAFYTSSVALAALPLTLAAAAHLSALVIAAYSDVRRTGTEGWYRGAALISGAAVLPLAVVFTLALASEVSYIGDQLTGPRIVPMVAGGVVIFLGTVALWLRRYAIAAVLTFAGYFAGLIGGAFAQYPYMVYPVLEIPEAAGPDPTLVAYLAVTAVGGPLLLAAMVALYHTTLGPAARRAG